MLKMTTIGRKQIYCTGKGAIYKRTLDKAMDHKKNNAGGPKVTNICTKNDFYIFVPNDLDLWPLDLSPGRVFTN